MPTQMTLAHRKTQVVKNESEDKEEDKYAAWRKPQEGKMEEFEKDSLRVMESRTRHYRENF